MKTTPLKLQLFWILSFGGHHTKHSSKTFASLPSYVQRERSSVIGSFVAALKAQTEVLMRLQERKVIFPPW